MMRTARNKVGHLFLNPKHTDNNNEAAKSRRSTEGIRKKGGDNIQKVSRYIPSSKNRVTVLRVIPTNSDKQSELPQFKILHPPIEERDSHDRRILGLAVVEVENPAVQTYAPMADMLLPTLVVRCFTNGSTKSSNTSIITE